MKQTSEHKFISSEIIENYGNLIKKRKELEEEEKTLKKQIELSAIDISKKIKKSIMSLYSMNYSKVDVTFLLKNPIIEISNYSFSFRYDFVNVDIIINKIPDSIEGISLSLLNSIKDCCDEVLIEEGFKNKRLF